MTTRRLRNFLSVLVLAPPLASSARAATFASLGPDGGRIDGFAQAPSNADRLYCLPHAQGVLRSSDRGNTWQRVDSGIGLDVVLQVIAVSPTNADLVLVGDPGQDRIQRSTDAGQTWAPIPIAGAWSRLAAIAFDPHDANRVLVAISQGAQSGVHRSTDAGLTWAQSLSGSAAAIAFHPGTAGIVLAGNGSGIQRSTDGGSSWAQVYSGWAVRGLSYCAQAPTTVWGIASNQVVRSTDGGQTFAATGQPPPVWEAIGLDAIAAHPTNSSSVVVGQSFSTCGGDCFSEVYRIVRSTNGGSSWLTSTYAPESAPSDETFASLAFDLAQPTTLWAVVANEYNGVAKNGLVRSTNSGASFNTWMNGIHGQAIRALDSDETGAVYARRAGHHGLWRAATAASTWEPRPTSAAFYPELFEASHTNPGRLVECGVESSMDSATPVWAQSLNEGQTWSSGDPPPVSGFVSLPLALASSFSGDATTYLWTDEWFNGAVVYRSDDGVNFTSAFPSFSAADAVIDPADDQRVFAVDSQSGAVQLSTDGGATWNPRSTGLPTATPVSILMDPSNGDRLAVVYRTAGAHRSEDGGLTWQHVPITLPSNVVAADWEAQTDRFALATQSDGVFVTGIGLVTDGLPTRQLTSVLFEPFSGKVLVGTAYAGVLSLDAPDPTEVSTIPGTGRLVLDVSPNPFRDAASIEFDIDREGEVRVEVFTVSGRRVATPYSGTASRGRQRVTWDGRDARGTTVASGVYFVRLRVGSEILTRRVVRLLP